MNCDCVELNEQVNLVEESKRLINLLCSCYNQSGIFDEFRIYCSPEVSWIGTAKDKTMQRMRNYLKNRIKSNFQIDKISQITSNVVIIDGNFSITSINNRQKEERIIIDYSAVFCNCESPNKVHLRHLKLFCSENAQRDLYYQRVFEIENDITLEVDASTKIVTLDQNLFVKLFGISLQDFSLNAVHTAMMQVLYHDDKEKYDNWWHKQFVESAGNNPIAASIEFRIRASKSESTWYKASVSPILNEDGIVIRYIGRIKNIDERKSREIIMHNLSTEDSLTGLLNRRYTEIEIDNYMQGDEGYGTLMMIDLDNFKLVNDKLGHLEGDRTLIAVAQLLKGACGKKDLIGRTGGDEFVVFLRKTVNKKVICDKAEQIINLLNHRTEMQHESEFHTTATIGIAVAPYDGNRFTVLWTRADEALYRMKKSGKNTFGFYNEGYLSVHD